MPDPYGNLRHILSAPSSAMQSYRIAAPPDVTVVAACEQVGCEAWRNGWDTIVDEATDLGTRQAAHIRSGQTGRTWREMARGDGLTVFRFDPKQRCFAEHRTRPETFTVAAGDVRSFGGLIRRHVRPVDWVEDMAGHLDDIRTARERG